MSLRSWVRASALAAIGAIVVPALAPTAAPAPRVALDPPPTAATSALTATATPTATPTASPTPSPCPAEMAHIAGPRNPEPGRLAGFCIDRFEAHLVVGGPNSPFSLWPHNQPAPRHRRYEARSEAGQKPQGYINQLQAARACDNAGKRLCRFDEWRRACLGERRLVYGYADAEEPGRCNSGKPHLLEQLWGHDARRWSYEEHMNNPLLDAIGGYLARAGEYERCASEDGIHDLVGNLHEWVSERVGAAMSRRFMAEKVRRQPQPYRLGNGILLGGFFSTGKQHGPGCYYTTLAHLPSYHDYSTGFRCCADAR